MPKIVETIGKMINENMDFQEGLEERYQRYRGILKNFTIMNDTFMRNVFKEPKCLETVLQIILDKKELHVIDQVIQKDYKNLQGRSAILDCVARDSEGKQIDVEIQQDSEGASPKRARYHSGLMDMNTLNPGQDFEKLPESYVIFITRDDVLGFDLPIYHIDRKIEEVGQKFSDEAHIIYVNSRKQEDSELGRLMHDLHCKNASDMYNKTLADRVHELKETAEGVKAMCKEMDIIYNEGVEKGMEKGMERGIKRGIEAGITVAKKETAINLSNMLNAEAIANAVKVDVETVKKWLAEAKNK